MSWRGALLFCLGCSFDPAGLEGRPAPCLDGYTEIDGRCYSEGAFDAGAPDVDVLTDARVSDVTDVSDPPDIVVVDALMPDVGVRLDAADGCACGMAGLIGCDPCEDGEHRSCRDGEVVTGASCVGDNTVATCDGDEEVFGECAAGCGESIGGWGCDFRPTFITGADRSTSVLEGNELRIDTRRGTVSLDGATVVALVSSVDTNLVLRVNAIDVDTIVVEGPGGAGIRASDTIRIRSGVDIGARGGVPGPGGFAMGMLSASPCGAGAEGEGEGGGGSAGEVATRGTGGGGGGFGSDGANGGNRGTCPGFGGGGNDHEVAFTGGSAGGGSENAAGGAGGGALYLSARVAIFVDGVIEASGGGGEGGVDSSGAGGGSGGLIYFEAPIFTTRGVELRANGGGGGGGARDGIAEDGEDGRVARAAAQGGDGSSLGGNGSGPMGEASEGRGSFARMAGGGGGGAGWIVIRTGDGEAVPDVQASPAMGSRSSEWQELP